MKNEIVQEWVTRQQAREATTTFLDASSQFLKKKVKSGISSLQATGEVYFPSLPHPARHIGD